MVGIFKPLRMREAIIREPDPLSWTEFATHPLHPTSVFYARLHAFWQPYHPYHGVMLARFQTRHLSSSRAEIPRQLKAKRDCQKTATGHGNGRQICLRIEGQRCPSPLADWPEYY